jgi:hypothetical protein
MVDRHGIQANCSSRCRHSRSCRGNRGQLTALPLSSSRQSSLSRPPCRAPPLRWRGRFSAYWFHPVRP